MARSLTTNTDVVQQGTAAMPTTGSLSCWLWPNWAWNDGVWHNVFSAVVDGNNRLNILKFSDNNWYAGWTVAGVVNEVAVSANGLVQNAWNLIALTWSQAQTRQRLYINGTQVGQVNAIGSLSTAGRARAWGNDVVRSGTDLLNGRLAELAVWNRELTAGEIGTLRTRRPSAVAAGLTDYVPLVGSSLANLAGGAAATVTGTSVAAHVSLAGGQPSTRVGVPVGL